MQYLDRQEPTPFPLTVRAHRGGSPSEVSRHAIAPPPLPRRAGPPPLPRRLELPPLPPRLGPPPLPRCGAERLCDSWLDAVAAPRRREHDERIADLRGLESLLPPPCPPHSLPPGAEGVAYLDGGLFPSSGPPGPVTLSLAPPGLAAPPIEAQPPSFGSPGRRAARVLGPVVAALAVGAGLLGLAGGLGLDPGEPTPVAPAAALLATPFDAPSQHGQPLASMPADAPREAPAAESTSLPTAERATPVASRMPQLGRPRVSTWVQPAAPKEALIESLEGSEAPTAAAGTEATETEAVASAPPFDSAAATRALADAELRAYRCNIDREGRDGVAGGEVSVTFAPSGRATTANVRGPRFSGHLEGSCVARIFRTLQVPAFSGEPVTVTKHIGIP